MADTHKNIVQQFVEAINAHQLNNLDKFLEHYVEKVGHGKILYANIEEAREYYSKELEHHPSAQCKVLDYQLDDPYNDTLTARVSYDNHTFHITYTFSSAGKIEKIHSVPEHHHSNQ